MTGVVESFSEVWNIPPCPVKLPNSEHVMATKEGTIILGSLCLKNVLFVPDLDCNLISVSKLARDKTLILKFTDCLCVVQDHTSRMLIEAGEE